MPRAASGHDLWLVAVSTAAVVSGGFVFGGGGWVVDQDGGLLAATSAAEPFVTVEADLNAADGAKGSYPRNVAGWLGAEGVSKARIEGASARAAALPNQKGSR